MWVVSSLRVWKLFFQMLQMHVFPEGHTKKTDHKSRVPPPPIDKTESTLVTPVTSTISSNPALSTSVTQTTTLPQTGELGETGTIPKRHHLSVERPDNKDREDDSGTDDSQRSESVHFVYGLRKQELIDELNKVGLSSEGSRDDLRKRFIDFIRSNEEAVRKNLYYNRNILHKSQPSDSGGEVHLPIPERMLGVATNKYMPRNSADVEVIQSITEILGLPQYSDLEEIRTHLLKTGSHVMENISNIAEANVRDQQNLQIPSKSRATETRVTYSYGPWGNIDTSRKFPPTTNTYHEGISYETSRQTHAANICNLAGKWNLHYDGDKDPTSFLERLGEFMDCHEVQPDEFIKALPQILRGKALLWYRNNKELWRNFKDFKQSFELQYLPPGYCQGLDDEIRQRTQGENESFRNFVVALTTLIRRRGNYTLDEKINRIYCNMRPDYKLTMKRETCYSVQDMIREAEHYESYLREKRIYRPPPNPAQALVPETAYQPYNRSNRKLNFVNHSDTKNEESRPVDFQYEPYQRGGNFGSQPTYRPSYSFPQSSKQTGKNETVVKKGEIPLRQREGHMAQVPNRTQSCWNCNKNGHIRRDCPALKTMQCYNCKREGVRTKDCNCKSGNGQRVPATR